MHKFILFILSVMLLVTSEVTAESELTFRETNKNAISLSLLDTGLLYSINYDHTFVKYFGLGVSGELAGGGGDVIGMGGIFANVYPIGSKTTALMVSAGANMITGDSLGGIDRFGTTNFYGNVGVGIEYRKDFLFRFKINTLFNNNGVLVPWPGVTFGYAF